MQDITSFLQSKGISRRRIVTLLQHWDILKNGSSISYRKENLLPWDIITIHWDTEYIVEQAIGTYDIILFNKPLWYVVSKNDDHNETIYSLLPDEWQQKYNYIGRLDKDSHGLLILTNATKLVSFFSHPRYSHTKKYHVQLDRALSHDDIQQGNEGIIYYDNDTKERIKLSRDSCKKIDNNTYEISISEWKKRHIRRLCEWLHSTVLDLCRVQFGPWKLDGIEPWKRQILSISSSDVENLLASQNSYIQKQI